MTPPTRRSNTVISTVTRRGNGGKQLLWWFLITSVVIASVGTSLQKEGKAKQSNNKKAAGEGGSGSGPAAVTPPINIINKSLPSTKDKNEDAKISEHVDGNKGQPSLPTPAPPQQQKPPPSTELTTDPLKTLLIISSLDGTLTAFDRFSGEVRWVSKDTKPMIQVPLQQSARPQQDESQEQRPLPKAPYFLPDPKTGSLYMMGKQNSLRKLPFTIPQLVSMAPCRNSEGLMYTGRKLDSWVMLNPLTGDKHEVPIDMSDEVTCPASPESEEDYCSQEPLKGRYTNPKSILIGRTEYSLSMMDGPRKWNVTYHHYSSNDMTAQSLQDYDLVHFTSPSEGHVLTYERSSGQLLWQSTLPSPVIGLYSIEGHTTNLVSVPFNPIASDTLERLRDGSSASSDKALNPTTYVGECAYGLYAVPALADEKVLVIGDGSRLPPLLAGPGKEGAENPDNTSGGGGDKDGDNYLLLGYYQTNEANVQQQQIESTSTTTDPVLKPGATTTTTIPPVQQFNESGGFLDEGKVIPVDGGGGGPGQQTQPSKHHTSTQTQTADRTIVQFPPPLRPNSNPTTSTSEPRKKIGKEVKIVFTTAIISIALTSSILGVVFVLYRRYKNNQLFETKKLILSSSDGGSGGMLIGSNGERSSGGSNGSRLIITETLPDGNQEMMVGKISFSPWMVLGKGCEGTFVFKGKFEGRDVAVKRIIPECFAFADREVDLLKESDQHVNVIRYFCTETDGQFRYIALELCVATLSDWVEGRYVNENVDGVDVLREASEGLAYLHSLRIVHRDVKPANVLLSEGAVGGGVRTLISDFGLCKKIQSGRMSYSRRSGGVPGTDGWIAPEVIGGMVVGDGESSGSSNGGGRMTYAVDIFSMGCVYYYVLSGGHHPFGGDAFRRQSNILSGEYNLSKISEDLKGVVELIKMMISMDPDERPPLHAILKHPLFWSNEKVLAFFLDVSDRIEKESEESFGLLKRFEEGGGVVVRGDWRDHICAFVAMDLRRYRTYKGGSVRDLLRALRNKKNHYRELGEDAQASLGGIPDEFVNYWVGRFPQLLPYTWGIFEGLKKEGVFSRYYHPDYDFSGDDVGYNYYDDYEGSAAAGISRGGGDEGENNEREGNDMFGGDKKVFLGKDFWRSKSQAKYQKWKRGGGRGGGERGSPRRYTNNIRLGGAIPAIGVDNNIITNNNPGAAGSTTNNNGELSASTDNYWRERMGGSRSPVRNRNTNSNTNEQQQQQ